MTGSSEAIWGTCLRQRPRAALRLFCFPYAGAGAGIFRPWLEHLPETIELWPVHLPGRERRIADEPIANIGQLARAVAGGLGELLKGRFAFFGHSMGALLSFELTRLLRQRELEGPLCLAISGMGAPQIPSIRPPVAHLPDSDFIAEVRRLNGPAAAASLDHSELVELLLPALRADFTAVETYSIADEAPLSCPIVANGGLNDPHVPREHLEGWGVHTSNEFAIRLFEGDHFYLHSQCRELTAILSRDLLSFS